MYWIFLIIHPFLKKILYSFLGFLAQTNCSIGTSATVSLALALQGGQQHQKITIVWWRRTVISWERYSNTLQFVREKRKEEIWQYLSVPWDLLFLTDNPSIDLEGTMYSNRGNLKVLIHQGEMAILVFLLNFWFSRKMMIQISQDRVKQNFGDIFCIRIQSSWIMMEKS